MGDMLMQGRSQAGCAQGMPAEEQEPDKAPGEKGRMIRSVLALYLLALSCLLPLLRYFYTAFASGHIMMHAQH